MPTPNSVPFTNEDTQKSLEAAGVRNLEFIVVNKPVASPTFEDLPKFDFTGVDMSPRTGNMESTLISTEVITIPDFKVTYNTYRGGQHTFPLDNYSPEMTMIDTSDETKATEAIVRTNSYGLQSAYVNRFSCGLAGMSTTTYTFSNGHSFAVETDYVSEDSSLTWDYIPLTTVFMHHSEAVEEAPKMSHVMTEGTQMVIYTPLVLRNRFDVEANKQADSLYKFDYYKLQPNETLSTVRFPKATSALLQICKGSAEIDGYHLDEKNFYEFDATKPLVISAGPEGAIAVASVKVTDLDLPA